MLALSHWVSSGIILMPDSRLTSHLPWLCQLGMFTCSCPASPVGALLQGDKTVPWGQFQGGFQCGAGVDIPGSILEQGAASAKGLRLAVNLGRQLRWESCRSV